MTGARLRLPGVPRDQSDTRRSAKTLTRPSPGPAPEPGTAFAASLSAEPGEEARRGREGCKAPQRGRVAATHPDSGRGPALGQAVSGRSWPSPQDARQSRGGAGRSAPRSSPRSSQPLRALARPARMLLGAGSQARGLGRRAGAGGAVGGGAGGGRGRARGPTCPGRAGQWAPGVRKDRHIWTCSGAARATAPRARPASLK